MEEKLTEKQQGMFDFIKDYSRVKGFPPTQREIADAVGTSQPVVGRWLLILEKRGLIALAEGTPRGIKVL